MDDFDPLSLRPPTKRSWGINFGGGLNSSALIVECLNRGHRPDWILFSDTGSERPETYAVVERMGRYLMERDLKLTVVRWIRRDGSFESLEDNCLRTGYLPSKAYGYSGCSSKWKIQPAQKWRKANGFADTVYAVGFDATEARRVKKRKCERAITDQEELREDPWYPLFAWGLGRTQCSEIVESAGLGPVGKSACFFCPNAKKHEWAELRSSHPGLFKRSLDLESHAIASGNASKFGLLRSAGYLRDYDSVILNQTTLWTTDDMTCMCSDGNTEDDTTPKESPKDKEPGDG